MTALAQDRSGLEISDEDLDALRSVSERTGVEKVKNKLSGRTEKRITFYVGGLDICTIVKEQGEVIEVKPGLLSHPAVSNLTS
jgi:hypothetical protein